MRTEESAPETAETRILMVDNHDSFVHTLVDYLLELGARVDFIEADAIAADAAADVLAHVDGVVISPGPGTPADAGGSIALVHAACRTRTPLLGVCLGHQAMAEAFGARVDTAPELRHGMASTVVHDGSDLFDGIPRHFQVGRYHSLAVTGVRAPLRVTARTQDGTVMALAHSSAPLWGVQFHPESVLTEYGYRLLGNWLHAVGMRDAAARARTLHVRGTAAAL